MFEKDYPHIKTARLAGILYLIWIVAGLCSLMIFRAKIDLKGDTSAIAQNILTNEFLFRTGIIIDIFNSCIWILFMLVFCRLFKHVNKYLTRLLFSFVIVQIPVVLIMNGADIAALSILKGERLDTFDTLQRQELAIGFLIFSVYTVRVLELYWGLWLLPLGLLAYRSRFIPGLFGIWLIINGIALLLLGITDILFPQYRNIVFNIGIPAMFGEVAFMSWLLIKGVRNGSSTITTITYSYDLPVKENG